LDYCFVRRKPAPRQVANDVLEVPTLGYVLRPDATAVAVARLQAGISRHDRRAGIWAAAVIGGLLVVRGTIELST